MPSDDACRARRLVAAICPRPGIASLGMTAMTNLECATWATAFGTTLLAVAALVAPALTRRNEKTREAARKWEAERTGMIAEMRETRRLLIIVRERPKSLQTLQFFGTVVDRLDRPPAVLMEAVGSAPMLQRWYEDNTGLDLLDNLIGACDYRIATLHGAESEADVPWWSWGD